ncbi:MAG: molybdenum cofactor guanylyltransferase MobA [Rudaea sp.]|nr:molybdenum cofactor guanylyltransferase MobA [Rudaea sp.]
MRFNPADITAAILAGGEGRRLGGRDKGLQPLSGRPLIAHVVTALAAQVQNLLICANRNTAQYAAFASVCADRTRGFHGPVAGIEAALVNCTTAWLLTVPVDCPRPPPDLSRRLYDVAHAADAKLAVAYDGMRRQPLFAIYSRELATSALSALNGNLPVWRWQDECGAVEVDFSDVPQGFLNLNSEEDFKLWEERELG